MQNVEAGSALAQEAQKIDDSLLLRNSRSVEDAQTRNYNVLLQ